MLEHLEPAAPLRFFEEISAIPRQSKEEAAVADYLVRFAESRNLPVYRDAVHNVVIKKAGTLGYESHEPVMLQGHTDMVCEKNTGTEHDFSKEGIRLILDGRILRADGTTLGADNGVAVAIMLALLDSDNLAHPPLECVFTVQEEVGLIGAAALDEKQLTAKRMINLDCGPVGCAIVSCAGGMRAVFSHSIERVSLVPSPSLSLAVRGLVGGHSGNDIHLERGNAIKILGRMLMRLMKMGPFQLCTIQGGAKDNAIPRESGCTLAFQDEHARLKAQKHIEEIEKELRNEYAESDPGLKILVTPGETVEQAFLPQLTKNLIELIVLAPNGVLTRSLQEGGFVVSSINLGVISDADNKIRITFSPRSSVQSLQEDTAMRLELLAGRFGFDVEFGSSYPGWSYAPISPLREEYQRCYKSLFGEELRVEAVHAGLECGLFAAKIPGLDAIAVGPDTHNIHTPDEYLDLDSYEKFWELLKAVLAKL